MIRQAISCDICASEKRQTNHWFVAYEQAGELRVSGWNSRHRLRPGSKHLCGQTCLHKLVDEFMAKSIAVRAQRTVEEVDMESPAVGDASLTSRAAHVAPGLLRTSGAPREGSLLPGVRLGPLQREDDLESSARMLVAQAPIQPQPAIRPQTEIVTMPPRIYPAEFAPVANETPRHASRTWHAQAWERERERELRAIENHPDIAARRRTSA